jgi:Glycosyl transferases group 1
MRHVGYESLTVAQTVYPAHERSDFDVHCDELTERGRLPAALRPYRPFAWALRRGDVFMLFFDGGFLRGTPLEWWEYPLMRLAGKRIVVSPYGGDIAVPGHLRSAEDALLADYPHLREQGELTKRRILHSLKHAQVSVLTTSQGFQPVYNAIWGNQLTIDTDLWNAGGGASDADGTGAPVVVVHAPNHRATKGTHFLERAVEELREEGLKIDLRIYEGRPNAEVRGAVLASDIVADQFVLEGYGQFAVEGMAAGKPVLANMSALPALFDDAAQVRDCPVVDANPDNLRVKLRALISDPSLRRRLGVASRDFVLRYHSYDAVGRDWGSIIEFAWRGRPLPDHLAAGDPAA